MMIFVYILAAVVLLGLCVFVHELGHLLGGKLVGIKARVFSLGYGKGFIKKTIGDTTYQVTLIPFGGYCSFYGDTPSEERTGEGYEFLSAAPWRRIVTVAMGPLFNLIFGIIIFFCMNMVGYEKETNRIYIPKEYQSGKYISAAFTGGMESGDRILNINNKKIRGFEDILMQVVFSEGRELNIKYERNGAEQTASVIPELMPETGRYAIGVLPFGNRLLLAGVEHGDVAYEAGLDNMDEVLSLDSIPIQTSEEFLNYVKPRAGKPIAVKILRGNNEKELNVTPRLNTMITMDGKPVFDTTILSKIVSEMSLKLDGKTVFSADSFVDFIKANRGKTVTIERKGNSFSGKIDIEERGYIGVQLSVAPESVKVEFGVGEGFMQALVEPYDFIVLNLKGIGMMFSGQMNVRENLSGPVRIAQIAGDVAYYKGIPAFILLMAKISIILMVMNLLPIPAVDGSHILFYIVEAIRGKPLSQKIMEGIQAAGIIILITLGVFVIINDISMLPAIQRLFN